MPDPSHRSEPAPALGPNPATRGMVTLALRLGLGVVLLDQGVLHHLQGAMGRLGGPPMPGRFRFPGYPPWMVPPTVAGWNEYARFFPYIEVAVGVALVLGFFTKAAALAAAFWPTVAHVVKVGFVLTVLGPTDPGAVTVLALNDVAQGGSVVTLLAASALIWVASWGDNPLSLDALMRRRGGADPAAGDPARHPGFDGADRTPGASAAGALRHEFEPERYVEGIGAGDDKG